MASLHSWVSLVSFIVLCSVHCGIVPGCSASAIIQHEPGTTVHPPPPASPMEEPPANYMSEKLLVKKEERKIQERQGRGHDQCKVISTSETHLGLHQVDVVKRERLSFFVKSKTNFRRLVFRIHLESVLELSDSFYTEQTIDIHTTEVEHSTSELKSWTRVEVEHYEHVSRGLNYHALRVSVGNTTLSLVTDYWWLLYDYEGFVIYAEGGVQVLFNCLPATLQQETLSTELSSSSYSGVWLMGGLLTTASVLLVVLLSVWLSNKCYRRRRRQTTQQSQQNVVYEEFDEEVLANLRQKVEALRSGKSRDDDLNIAGKDGSNLAQENPYVLDYHLQKKQDAPSPRSSHQLTRRTGETEAEVESHRYYENFHSMRHSTPTTTTEVKQETMNQTQHHYVDLSLTNSQLQGRY